MSKLRIVVNVGKGSPLTSDAWVDILFGGIRVVDHAEVTALYKSVDLVQPNAIEFTTEYDGVSYMTLTVLNAAETIGPIQIYNVEFYIDDVQVPLTWQTAIKGKPLRFGGQPNTTITNPHVGDPELSGWCSVPDVSPGMSITWGLPDLITIATVA